MTNERERKPETIVFVAAFREAFYRWRNYQYAVFGGNLCNEYRDAAVYAERSWQISLQRISDFISGNHAVMCNCTHCREDL